MDARSYYFDSESANDAESSVHQATSQDPRIGASHVPESRLAKPKRDKDSPKSQSATHRRRSPRICVGSQ
ncbi:hypothetical protein PIB30_102828 [Stylosanthes scabra]|uniref:Uncharacterized protein n=1 Tax=Stylosanthes scabra TaxID=79078 RepID=A0ABU6XX03_9FABA|nr:hypothetical protein [Stylosanthes scabra]